MMWRDERRFRAADTNGDMVADKAEFTAFLHPEDHDHMKDIVVQVSRSPPSVMSPPPAPAPRAGPLLLCA